MYKSITLRLFTAGAAGVFAAFSCVACVQGQDFVIRDRVAEARTRIFSQQGNEPVARVVVPAPMNPSVESRDISQARIQASTAMYTTAAAIPEYEDTGAATYRQEEYTSSVLHHDANEPYYSPAAGHSQVQIGSGQPVPGPGARWSNQFTPGVVLTNSHFFEGTRGPGVDLPFYYSSSYCRSGRGPETDAAGNPIFCDEWIGSWPCPCCDQPIGLPCLHPWGHAYKKHGHLGKTGCKGCSAAGNSNSCGTCGPCDNAGSCGCCGCKRGK